MMSAPPNYYDQGIKNNLFQFIWHKRRFGLIKGLLLEVNGRILDIGCHGGTFTEEISKILLEAEVFGIDIDSVAIAYARKKRPTIKFQVAGAEKLPFSDKSFKLITCLEVLEHLKNPQQALREVGRCLQDDGKLIILVPSESLLFRLVWFCWTLGKGKVWRGTHLHNLGDSFLSQLLKENGFEILEEKTSHLGMLRAVKAKKIRPR